MTRFLARRIFAGLVSLTAGSLGLLWLGAAWPSLALAAVLAVAAYAAVLGPRELVPARSQPADPDPS